MSITPAPWLDYDTVNALGWTLIHFLWQGAVLLLPLQLILPFCQSARARYNVAFATLLAMAAAPVATFLFIHGHDAEAVMPSAVGAIVLAAGGAADDSGFVASFPWMNWVVSAWFAGVAVLSIRMAGGWYAAHRLTKRHTAPLPRLLLARCERLVAIVGIARPVRFLQSTAVSVPAVVGWLKPVILLPLSAVTGFTPAQLDAVIMHELGHIRRLDALANLLQIAVETTLFYHPAVWWLSRRIRIERENCCDDIAVALSGDAVGYARALTVLEEWRGMPVQAVAASGGVLKQRIARLLGLHVKAGNTSALAVAGIALLCLASCVVAKGASEARDQSQTEVKIASDASKPEMLVPPPVPPAPARPPIAVTPAVPALPALPALPRVHGDRDTDVAEAAREAAREARERGLEAAERAREQVREAREAARDALREHGDRHTFDPFAGQIDQAYIDGMKAAGLKDVPANRLIALKLTGVTPDYVKALHDAGLNPSPEQILALHAQGMKPEFIKEMRAAGLDPSPSQLVALRSQGITADFVRAARGADKDVSVRDIINMRAMHIEPAEAGEFKRLGLSDVSMHALSSFKALGVTPEYISSLRDAGLDMQQLSSHDLTSFKATGVTPDLVKALKAMNLKDMNTRDYVTAQVRGLTPDFLAAVRNHNFTNLTMRQLLVFKEANVF